MPTLSPLRALFAHNDWANRIVVERAASLTDEQLDRVFDMGCGSIRSTLAHIARAEEIWFQRWRDGLASGGGDNATASIDDIADAMTSTAEQRGAFLDQLGPEGEGELMMYTRDGTIDRLHLGDMMLHVANHGVHHRSQLCNMFRSVGAKPVRLDYLHLRRTKPDAFAVDFDPPTLGTYLDYGDWAREQLAAAASALDDAELDRTFAMGIGTLRTTLQHVHDAEQWWLQCWSGESPASFPELVDSNPLPDLLASSADIATRRRAILEHATPDSLAQIVTAHFRSGVPAQFQVGDTMMQLGGHGTHHRAQAVNMLRDLGVEMPAIDYVLWRRELAQTA